MRNAQNAENCNKFFNMMHANNAPQSGNPMQSQFNQSMMGNFPNNSMSTGFGPNMYSMRPGYQMQDMYQGQRNGQQQ